jgi:hypothetical protein
MMLTIARAKVHGCKDTELEGVLLQWQGQWCRKACNKGNAKAEVIVDGERSNSKVEHKQW